MQPRQPFFANPGPKPEIKRAMDYKGKQISSFQKEKEEGMRIMSSGRDAVLIVTNLYGKEAFKTDGQIQDKIVEWRNWAYKNLYTFTDEEYKQNTSPF